MEVAAAAATGSRGATPGKGPALKCLSVLGRVLDILGIGPGIVIDSLT